MVVSNISYFHSYLGKISILTNIFQLGSNHQLDQVRCNFCLQSAWGACLVDGFGIAILWFSDWPALRRRNKSLEKLGCGNKLCKGSSIHTPTKVVELSSPLSPIFTHFSFGYLDFFEAILLFRCEKQIPCWAYTPESVARDTGFQTSGLYQDSIISEESWVVAEQIFWLGEKRDPGT